MDIQGSKMVSTIGKAGLAAAVLVTTQAFEIPIDSTDPTWSNAVNAGTTAVYNAINGTYTDVRWGVPAEQEQSGLGFDPANPPTSDVAPDTLFLFGSLRHYNNPVFAPIATSVDLNLLTSISGAVPSTQNFAFRFFIDETPNVTPCAYPSTTPCADRITFSNLDLSSSFSFGGMDYTLELLGFSLDGGTTLLSYFDSQEGGTNTAALYGRITQATSVPEPGTIALLGLGLAGLGFARRRKLN